MPIDYRTRRRQKQSSALLVLDDARILDHCGRIVENANALASGFRGKEVTRRREKCRRAGGASPTTRSIAKRDKMNLDIFWLKDKSLEDSANLPEPDVLAQEIADDLQTALEQFSAIAAELRQ